MGHTFPCVCHTFKSYYQTFTPLKIQIPTIWGFILTNFYTDLANKFVDFLVKVWYAFGHNRNIKRKEF